DPDTIDRLAADLGLVDRGMETRQLRAKLFHDTNLRVARLLFCPWGSELHSESPRRHTLRRRVVGQERAIGPDRNSFNFFRLDQGSNPVGRLLRLSLYRLLRYRNTRSPARKSGDGTG